MARYPGATWRPIDPQYLSGLRMAGYNRVNYHVTASKGSPWAFFNGKGRASSHFFIYKNGVVEQFVDTAYRAEADLDGNDATISIETEGGYPGSIANSEPWIAEQIVALIELTVWLCKTHSIPPVLASDAKPGVSSKGISWHRLGIDGSFPRLPDVRAGRLQRGGGMHYSNATGKACPGDKKIQQIPDIVTTVSKLVSGEQPPLVAEEKDMAFVTQYGRGEYYLVTGDQMTNISESSALRWKADGGMFTALDNTDVLALKAKLIPENASVTTGDVTVDIDYAKFAAAVQAGVKNAIEGTELQFGPAD